METTTYSKPGFDARLQYYEHLKQWWNLIANATMSSNFYELHIALSNYFALIQPFIKDTESNKLKVELIDLEKQTMNYISKSINKKGQVLQNFLLHKKFNTFKEDLHLASRHFLLPVKQEEKTDMDEEEFLKAFAEGSGM